MDGWVDGAWMNCMPNARGQWPWTAVQEWCACGCTDNGWMNEQTNKWMQDCGLVGRWPRTAFQGWCACRCADKWRDEWMNEWIIGCANGRSIDYWSIVRCRSCAQNANEYQMAISSILGIRLSELVNGFKKTIHHRAWKRAQSEKCDCKSELSVRELGLNHSVLT
jgi:hypothetical protein